MDSSNNMRMPDWSFDERDDEALDGVSNGPHKLSKDPVKGTKACQGSKSEDQKAKRLLSIGDLFPFFLYCYLLSFADKREQPFQA